MKTIKIENIQEIEGIIGKCKFCIAGLNGKDGYPYLFPMNFAYTNGKIILHSAPQGSHIELIELDNRITITFCTDGDLVYQNKNVACSYRMNSKSVICRGKVNFIEDLQEKEKYLNEIMKHYTDKSFGYSEPALKNVKLWVVKINEMTARAFGQPHQR